MREQKALTNLELRMRKRDGSAVWVLENMNLLNDGGSEAVIEGTIIDITERRRFQDRLQHLVDHDPLTGVLNRRSFERELILSRLERHHWNVPAARASSAGLVSLGWRRWRGRRRTGAACRRVVAEGGRQCRGARGRDRRG